MSYAETESSNGFPVPFGSVFMYAGTQQALPLGYSICDGSLLSVEIYPDLFGAIGTNYDTTVNTGTFRLPRFETGDSIRCASVPSYSTRNVNYAIATFDNENLTTSELPSINGISITANVSGTLSPAGISASVTELLNDSGEGPAAMTQWSTTTGVTITSNEPPFVNFRPSGIQQPFNNITLFSVDTTPPGLLMLYIIRVL